MKWLTNLRDPRLPDARDWVHRKTNQSPEDALCQQEEWLQTKTIGQPRATATSSVEQLVRDNTVGIYE
jgi:hypothetical protein